MEYTGERVIPDEYRRDPNKFLIFLLHVKSYEHAMPFVRGKRVLDFGCGTGYGAQMLADHADDVTAVDISEEAISSAATSYSANNLHFLRIEPIETAALPFPDGDFEVVISFQVIEHIRYVETYLRQIRRILRPGGRLLLTTPNSALRLLPGWKPWNRFHVREYTYRALKQTLQKEFPFVEVSGITATDPWLRMEKSRVNRLKWLTSPFTHLLMPEVARQWVLEMVWSRLANRRRRLPNTRDGRAFPEGEDVFITSSAVDRCLKFFAVCGNGA
jgi:2-polyprenyl-3-methyl-5-hydroxy-6-metoxy-1,4-benzoquinol methylase